MTIKNFADLVDANNIIKVTITRNTDEKTQEETHKRFEDVKTFKSMMDLFLESVENSEMEEINKMNIEWVDIRKDEIVIKVYR